MPTVFAKMSETVKKRYNQEFIKIIKELRMKKTYVTFGQGHYHNIRGQIFNPNTVAIIPCEDAADGRAMAFATFGPKFCFEYHEDQFKQESMKFFPEGFVTLNDLNINEARGDIEDGTKVSSNR